MCYLLDGSTWSLSQHQHLGHLKEVPTSHFGWQKHHLGERVCWTQLKVNLEQMICCLFHHYKYNSITRKSCRVVPFFFRTQTHMRTSFWYNTIKTLFISLRNTNNLPLQVSLCKIRLWLNASGGLLGLWRGNPMTAHSLLIPSSPVSTGQISKSKTTIAV